MRKFEEEVHDQSRLTSIAEFLIQMIGKQDKFQHIANDLVKAYLFVLLFHDKPVYK